MQCKNCHTEMSFRGVRPGHDIEYRCIKCGSITTVTTDQVIENHPEIIDRVAEDLESHAFWTGLLAQRLNKAAGWSLRHSSLAVAVTVSASLLAGCSTLSTSLKAAGDVAQAVFSDLHSAAQAVRHNDDPPQ